MAELGPSVTCGVPARIEAWRAGATSGSTTMMRGAVPQVLPSDHPPTLFLHGENDLTVPVGTMHTYANRLEAQGIEVHTVVDPDAGHAWLEVAPDEIPAFFLR